MTTVGKQDTILAQSLSLGRRFASPVQLQHDAGHAIPISLSAAGNPQREAVEKFVKNQAV